MQRLILLVVVSFVLALASACTQSTGSTIDRLPTASANVDNVSSTGVEEVTVSDKKVKSISETEPDADLDDDDDKPAINKKLTAAEMKELLDDDNDNDNDNNEMPEVDSKDDGDMSSKDDDDDDDLSLD
jgi:hypothetical protein